MPPKRKANPSSPTQSKKPKLSTHTREETKDFYKSTINLVLNLSEDDYKLATEFIKVPSKKIYPDYYEIIKNPIAISDIQKKINTKYTGESTQEFLDDFKLLLTNAATYNDSESWIVQTANKIVEFVEDQVSEFDRIVGPASSEPKHPKIKLKLKQPSSLSKSNDAAASASKPTNKSETDEQSEISYGKLPELCIDVITDVRDHEFEDIGVISGPFLDEVDQEVYTDYSNFVSKPMAFNTIINLLQHKKLFTPKVSLVENLQKFHDTAALIFSNAKAYNNEASQIYQDAETLESYFEEQYGKLKSKAVAADALKPKTPKLKINLNRGQPEKKKRKPLRDETNDKENESLIEEAAEQVEEEKLVKDEILPKIETTQQSPPKKNPPPEIQLEKTTENTLGKSLPTLLPSNSIIQESSIFTSPAIIPHITKFIEEKASNYFLSRDAQIIESMFPTHPIHPTATLVSYKIPANGYVDQSYTISFQPEVSPFVSFKASLHHLLYKAKESDLVDGHGYLNSTSDDEFQCKLTINNEDMGQPNDCFEEQKEKESVLAVQYDVKLAHGLNVLTFECKVAPSLSKKIKNTVIQHDQVEELSGSRHTRHQLQQIKMTWDVETITLYIVCTNQN
ncbi:uncharacterized protein KGF55_001689 [Candida pseudojiufengensis]|uniref:uncharacterized protein n=1 Tax=Candida pseudojiufengensis TaxID=497109 RepID=UPI00222506E8|nr:uncharacterized protein KGF55_001689 [Candida pseudojiufengensis]KAI5964620.1 hypothetical protein KGF55_001689 [Candida pseudojiufengensis]